MLKLATVEISRTHLMHKALLTHSQLLEYLGHLQKHGLITIGENKYLKTTAKGKKLIEAVDTIGNLGGIFSYAPIED